MASRTDDIERQIAERRANLSRRADGLRSSVRDLQSVPQSLLNESGVQEQINRRPLTSVGAAFASGLVLGAVTKSSGNRDGKGDQSDGAPEGKGLLGGMMGFVEGAAGDELLRLAKEMLSKRQNDSQRGPAPPDDPGVGQRRAVPPLNN